MQVRQILNAKVMSGVETVRPDTTIAEVAELLARKKIGAVIVSQSGDTADGIVSERDIVRELGRRGTGCLTDTARAVMTANLVTCAPSDRSHSLFAKMTEGRFRHLPVVEDGKMIGLVSIGDVVAAQMSELKMEKKALESMVMGVDVGG
ncbi:MAG: CBS domain-containing protein [Pseudomonadota bacterium]